jgi:hypothetical protein
MDVMKAAGMPLPFIFTPHPVVGMATETIDRYIEGNDPDTNKLVANEIIDALTRPIGKTSFERSSSKVMHISTEKIILKPDTEENLQREFFKRGWTDGLPIILPTEERVTKMLAGTGSAPDKLVSEVMQPETKEVTRYTVADIGVIAVMAGAGPEHFPVILAVASTNQSALTPSTTPFAAMLLVNGPIRNEIGMNSGIGAYSPINQANSVIGRAWTLMSACAGFNTPERTFWSSQGNNLTYNSMCAGENEEKSVWTPFHVQKGFKPEESIVSVFRGWNMLNSLHCATGRTVGEEIDLQLSVIPALNSNATIIMDPSVARNLKENEGFNTKQDYSRWLSKNVKIPAGRYWKTDYIDMLVVSQADKGEEPYASWKKLTDDELIPHYHNPDNINIIVVGGETSPLWKTSDYRYVTSASIDNWRPTKSEAECKDGSCGVPDEAVDYDD